jgi:hypothetical protein
VIFEEQREWVLSMIKVAGKFGGNLSEERGVVLSCIVVFVYALCVFTSLFVRNSPAIKYEMKT